MSEIPDKHEDAAREGDALHPRDYVALARGFSRLLWSMPISLLLFTGVLYFSWHLYIRLPTYIIGVVLFLWGIHGLRGVRGFSPAWKRYIRAGYLLAFLLMYFAPFVFWWRAQPETDHFVLNVFALLLTFSWALLVVTLLTAEWARTLQDKVFFIESRLCAVAIFVFMSAPMLVYFTYATIYAFRYNLILFRVLEDLRFLPFAHWLFALMLMPVSLTMTIAWKAKERAFHALTA